MSARTSYRTGADADAVRTWRDVHLPLVGHVGCPACRVAAGAVCVDRRRDGWFPVRRPHRARVETARAPRRG